MPCVHALVLSVLLSGVAPAAAAEDFFAAADMRPMTPERLDAAHKRLEADVLWSPAQPGHPLGALDPMAMALALVHRNAPAVAHARYRIRLYRDPGRPHDDFVEVLRIDHAPRLERELVATYGIEHADPTTIHHPAHLLWRLQLGNLRGMPLIHAAANASMSGGAIRDAQCLGLPCLSGAPIQESPRLQDGSWHTWAPPADVDALQVPLKEAGGPPGPSGTEHPAQMAWKTVLAFLGDGSWESAEGDDAPWHQRALAELVLDLQLHGQDDNQQATICQFDLADDSVRDQCLIYRTVANFGEFQRYAACHRDSGSQGLCL